MGQGFDLILRYDVFFFVGKGILNEDNEFIEYFVFSKEWLKCMNIEFGMVVFLGVKGESMQLILFDGDLVLVDWNCFFVKSGKIYVFVDGDNGVRVKWLCLFGNVGFVI